MQSQQQPNQSMQQVKFITNRRIGDHGNCGDELIRMNSNECRLRNFKNRGRRPLFLVTNAKRCLVEMILVNITSYCHSSSIYSLDCVSTQDHILSIAIDSCLEIIIVVSLVNDMSFSFFPPSSLSCSLVQQLYRCRRRRRPGTTRPATF